MVETIQQLLAPKYLEMQREIERRLASFGLTLEEFSHRSFKIVEGNVTTYYFDNKPLVESEISFNCNQVKFEVRAVTHV